MFINFLCIIVSEVSFYLLKFSIKSKEKIFFQVKRTNEQKLFFLQKVEQTNKQNMISYVRVRRSTQIFGEDEKRLSLISSAKILREKLVIFANTVYGWTSNI